MNAKITRTINRIGLQIKKHSPEIMMVAGIAGTVVSAVMAYCIRRCKKQY
jgi:hypothetical protein